jgi:UTP-glucose-1-phosphate uridylyltransferase
VPVVEIHDYQQKRASQCSINFNFLGFSQSENPQHYGVLYPFTIINSDDDDDKFKNQYFFVDHIEEKPEKPDSKFVIAGRYIFNKQIFTDLHNLENTKNNHFNNEKILAEVLNDIAYRTLAMRAGDTFYDIGNRRGFIAANAVLSREIQKEKE